MSRIVQSTSNRCQLLDLSLVENTVFSSICYPEPSLNLKIRWKTCLEVVCRNFIEFRKLKNQNWRSRHCDYKFIDGSKKRSLKVLQLHRRRVKNQFQAINSIQTAYYSTGSNCRIFIRNECTWQLPRMESSIFVLLSQMDSSNFSVCCAVIHLADLWRFCLRFHTQRLNPL